MPFHADRSSLAILLEIALSAVGFCLLWRLALSPGARASPQPARLTPWNGRASDLLGLFFSTATGAIAAPLAARFLFQRRAWDETHRLLIGAVAFQFGLLLGVMVFHFVWKRLGSGLKPRPIRALLDGGGTFLAALPIVYAVTFFWQLLLSAFGVQIQSQDSLKLFESVHSWTLRLLFSATAIVVAPLAEELFFRAGLFRYLRGRLPLGIAVLLSALFFGCAHLIESPLQNLPEFLPLVALGAVFSIAYERTGRIGTTIVAHALFNLNTVLFLWAGQSV